MRGSKAKVLRRMVYGQDLSLKTPRQYLQDRKTHVVFNHPNTPRCYYQVVKSQYMKLGSPKARYAFTSNIRKYIKMARETGMEITMQAPVSTQIANSVVG